MRVSQLMMGALLFLLGSSSAAHAAFRPWIRASGGLSQYAFDSVNKNEVTNWRAAGFDLEPVKKGIEFAGDVGFEVGRGLSIGAGYHQHTASTEGKDGDASVKLDFGSVSPRGFVEYVFANNARTDVLIGFAVGQLELQGTKEVLTAPGAISIAENFKATELVYEPYMAVNLWIASRLGLFGLGGLRIAEIKDVVNSDDGASVYYGNGRKMKVDYGGLYGRAGLTLAFTR